MVTEILHWDVEECLVQSLPQSQFTPLPEALCWVVLELTSAGQPASLDAVRAALQRSFPVSEPPSEHTVYDALAKLMQERKVYHTSRGYFVVTPESRRRRSNSSGRSSSRGPHGSSSSPLHTASGSAPGSAGDLRGAKTVLMSTDEALAYIHGEMETIKDGEITHQAIQTNLADVICGGNPNDKILYARVRLSSPAGRLLERRHSLRLFGSKKRLSTSSSLPRSGSMRLSPLRQLDFGDCSVEVKPQEKSQSFLARLFRRGGSGRNKRHSGKGEEGGDQPLSTFSAQFPPAEWFNQSVVHLHSVGTQTNTTPYSLASARSRDPLGRSQGSLPWSSGELPSRAATLPRRRRHLSGETSLTLPTSAGSGSYANTPRSSRKSAPSSNGTLPRSSSRNRSSSSSGSKLTGSPSTSIIEAPSTVISSSASPSRKVTPVPVSVRPASTLKPVVTTSTPSRPVVTSSPSSIFTLQVSSRTSPQGLSNEKPSVVTKSATNGDVTTTITGNGNSSTRLCVLQSPTRSVVTLNGSPVTSSNTDSPRRQPRPSSLYSPREKKPTPPPATPATTTTVYLSTSKRFPSVENLTNREDDAVTSKKLMNANQNNIKASTNAVKPSNINDTENHHHQPSSTTTESMNNIIDLGRKKSETLSSLKNLLYSSNTELNSSSAALMSLDKTLRASDSMNLMENMGKVPCSPTKLLPDDDLILDKVNGDLLHSSYPSLSDLTVHFKSLAAQKILKGISINSIDTLVEVNMAAAANNEKQNNCDVTIHTDFGLV
ncbi:hypothetical protein B566_EDAN016084 [Ephemera danica]|nr:hypothetical protein B566_EDAN016084 [Ephemera danica]